MANLRSIFSVRLKLGSYPRSGMSRCHGSSTTSGIRTNSVRSSIQRAKERHHAASFSCVRDAGSSSIARLTDLIRHHGGRGMVTSTLRICDRRSSMTRRKAVAAGTAFSTMGIFSCRRGID